MKKAVAEFVGTFTLVLLGCGAAVIAGDEVGVLGIAVAFGLALVAAAYGIGPISGCHINPAVSLAVFIAGRMTTRDLGQYVLAQVGGAICAAVVLLALVSGRIEAYDVAVGGLGQNGWGAGYGGGYGLGAALLFETVATFLFVVAILGATQSGAPAAVAGLAIGFTLVVIHIVGIPITGVSVNPARSIGPALMVGGAALGQLWLFIVAPCIGATAAAVLFRSGWLEADRLPAAQDAAAAIPAPDRVV